MADKHPHPRAGARRGEARKRTFQPKLLLLAVAVTLSVVAWGYLVYAAIDFGATARSGESRAWWFLAVAALGAVTCLFVGLLLIARLLRALGITAAPEADESPARAPGGRRASR